MFDPADSDKLQAGTHYMIFSLREPTLAAEIQRQCVDFEISQKVT